MRIVYIVHIGLADKSTRLLYMLDEKDPLGIGKILRERRTGLGLSTREVARRAGISNGLVSGFERGDFDPRKSSAATLKGLARGLNWTFEDLQVILGLQKRGNSLESILNQVSHLEVHPRWLMFPVYASVSAGKKDPDPMVNEVAYFPADKLKKKGVKPAFARVFLVNGDCMISDEARRIDKNIAPYDYILVDTEHRPTPGDVVVAWWEEEQKLVVKRFRIEGRNVILYPSNPGHPQILLDSEDEVHILGRVVLRVG